jgi:DNA (cytosine-5)-methyltransferase 1
MHLFAGAGGGILGGILLGHTCVCAVEIEPYCRKVLLQRQRDGILPKFPIWDDVRTFDGRPWRGRVDVVAGGFPCKGISVAGGGAGLDHEESGLWSEQARIIGEVRPRFAFIENSPMLTLRGGVRVIADLAQMGYDCRWGIISAADAIWTFGNPCLDHERARIWIMAKDGNTDRTGRLRPGTVQEFCSHENGARAAFERGRSAEPGTIEPANQTTADDNQFRLDRRELDRKGIRGGHPTCDETGPSDCATTNPNSARKLQPQGSERDERGRAGYGGKENTVPRPDPIGEQQSRRWTSRDGRLESSNVGETVGVGTRSDTDSAGWEKQRVNFTTGTRLFERDSWWASEPGVVRMAHGVANRVDRLTAIGNGQVSAVVEIAWETLIG